MIFLSCVGKKKAGGNLRNIDFVIKSVKLSLTFLSYIRAYYIVKKNTVCVDIDMHVCSYVFIVLIHTRKVIIT